MVDKCKFEQVTLCGTSKAKEIYINFNSKRVDCCTVLL